MATSNAKVTCGHHWPLTWHSLLAIAGCLCNGNAASVLAAEASVTEHAGVGYAPFDSLPIAAMAAMLFAGVVVLALGTRWLARFRRAGATRDRAACSTSTNVERRSQQLAASESQRGNRDALGWAADGTPSDSSSLASRPDADRQKMILIADDDPVVMFALTQRLQHLGYQVFRSPDAAHALLGVLKCHPDLVILDVNMPSGNGLAVCEMMASDPRYAKIPVIIHSGFSDESMRARCLRMGAHHVEKSSHSWTEIRQLVEALIGDGPQAPPPGDSEPSPAADAAAQNAPAAVAPRTGDADHQLSEPEIDASSAPVGSPETRPETAAPSNGEPHEPAPLSSDPPVATSHRTSPVCGGCRLICIESPADRLQLVDHQLTALGLTVVRTSDLEEGFWTCFTERPQAVVLQAADHPTQLRALLEKLAQHPVTRVLPVLLINENNLISDQEAARYPNLGVLRSPMDWEDLLGRLALLTPMFSTTEDDPLTRPASPHDTARSGECLTGGDSTSPLAADLPEPLTILSVDDDPLISRSLAIRLRPYGITVLEAGNGTQGYLTAVTQHPNLILLDLQVPNGDGNYVLGKLRVNPETEAIPVIVLTMETHPGVHRTVLANGAQAVLCKPIRWRELFIAMERCIPLPKPLMADYKLFEESPV